MITKPRLFGGLFFATILVFAIVYAIFPSTIKGVNNFLDALYFSIVTITTLGFGEIYPEGLSGRLLVCTEALLGIVFIGMFLNAISESQAHIMDENEKARSKQERRENAKAKLRQYYIMLRSIMERYLTEVYALTTPLDKRKFPEDVMHHHFQFKFNDLSDLYQISLLLFDPPYKPVVATFFDVQDKLYSELRSLVSEIDISYWETLEKAIHAFLRTCNDFAFKESILSFAQPTINNNTAEIMSKMIREHEGELKMLPSNAINQYISLFSMVIINTALVQQMAEEMRQGIEE